MASILNQLRDYLDRLNFTFNATSSATQSVKSNIDSRVTEASAQLNTGYNVFRNVRGSASVVQSQPSNEDRYTPPSASSVFSQRTNTPFYQFPTVQFPSQPAVQQTGRQSQIMPDRVVPVEEEKPEVVTQASPQMRLLPDQMLREKERVFSSFKGEVKSQQAGGTVLFDLEPESPVYVDVKPSGGITFTSKATPFQLFIDKKSQFYVLPVKEEDGSIDVTASKIQLQKSGLQPHVIDSLLTQVTPVKAFAGITDILSGNASTLGQSTPLTLGKIEDGKEVYFNPVTNEITTDWTPYRVSLVTDGAEMPDRTQFSFSITSVLDDKAVPIIADESIKFLLNNFVSSAFEATQTLKYIGNISDTGQVSGQQAFDTDLVLRAYSPTDVRQGEKQVATVSIYNQRGELQPLDIRTEMRKESGFGVVAETGWQLLIASGDEPERGLSANPFIAGNKPVNLLQTISDRIGVAINTIFSNIPISFNQALLSINRQIATTWKSSFIISNLFGGKVGRDFILGQIAKAEKNIERYQQAIDEAIAKNHFARVSQAIRAERSINQQLTYNQITGYLSAVADEIGDLSKVKVERDWKGDGFIVFEDGNRVAIDKYLSSLSSYKGFVKEIGETSAKRLFNILVEYPDTFASIINAEKLKSDLYSKQNFVFSSMPVIQDIRVQRAVRTANLVNAISNLDLFVSAIRATQDGKLISTQSEIINHILNNSLSMAETVSKEEADFMLEVLNSRYNDLIIADVANRLADNPAPTFADIYFAMREVYPFYFSLDNMRQAERFGQTVVVENIPSGRNARDWKSYLDSMRDELRDDFTALKSYISNMVSTSQQFYNIGERDRADKFFNDAIAFSEGTMQFDRLVRRVTTNQDIFASYAWEVRPDAYFLFLKNVALAETQLGRPLTPTEIIDIRDNTVPLEFIIAGQMVFDATNLLDLIGGAGIAVDLVKDVGKITGITSHVVEPAVEIAKKTRLVRFFTDLSIRSKVQKASYQIGDFFVQVLGDRLYSRIDDSATGIYNIVGAIEEAVYAVNRARSAINAGTLVTDDLYREAGAIFRTSSIAQQFLPSYVSDNMVERFMKAVDTFVLSSGEDDIDVIAKRISNTLEKAIDKSLSQFDAEVSAQVNKGFKRWLDNLYASVRKDLSLRLGRRLTEISDDLVADELLGRLIATYGEDIDLEVALKDVFRKEVLSNISKNRQFVHFIFSTSDEFIRLGRNLNRAWLGTNLLSDSFLGTVGRKFPIAQPFVRLIGNAYDLFMGMWVTATLARRPAWVVFNQLENLFRFVTLSVFNPSEYKQMIFGLIPDTSREKILQELGVIPADIGIDFLPIQTITDDDRFLRIFAGRSIASLSENPFKWLTSHYFTNIQEIWKRGGFLTRLFAPYSAFVSSVQSFNQVIEYGMRLRVYTTLLKRNLKQVMPNLLQLLAGDLQALVEENAQSLRIHLLDFTELSEEEVERSVQRYIEVAMRYVDATFEQINENIVDPLRVLSIMSRNSTSRFISLLGILNPSLYPKLREIGTKSNLQQVLSLVSSRLSDELLKLADEGIEPKVTVELVSRVIDELTAELDSAYGTAVNFKVRQALNEAIFEADAVGRAVPPSDADEVIDISNFTRPPRPAVGFTQQIENDPTPVKRVLKNDLDTSIQRLQADLEQAKSASKNTIFSKLRKIFTKEEPAPQVPSSKSVRIVGDKIETPAVQVTVTERVDEVIQTPIEPTPAVSSVTAVPDKDLADKSVEAVEKVKEVRKRRANARIDAENQTKKKKGESVLKAAANAQLSGADITKVAGDLPEADALLVLYSERINKVVSDAYGSLVRERYGTDWVNLSISQRSEFLRDFLRSKEAVLFEKVLGIRPENLNIGRVDILSHIDTNLLPQAELPLFDFIFRDNSLGVLNKNALEFVTKQLYPQQIKIAMLDVRGLHATNGLTVFRGSKQILGGYAIGDAYLKHVVDVLSENGLTVYRQGGDEFVVLFPKAMSDDEIRGILDKVSDEIASRPISIKVQINDKERVLEFSGARVNYGIGETFAEASERQKLAKDEFFNRTGLDRNTYHLQINTKGYRVTGVSEKVRSADEAVALRKQVSELKKQVSKLEKQVAALSEQVRVAVNSGMTGSEFQKQLLETNRELLNKVSEITDLMREGKIVVVSGEVASDGTAVRTVSGEASGAVDRAEVAVAQADALTSKTEPKRTKVSLTSDGKKTDYQITVRQKPVLFSVITSTDDIHGQLKVAFEASDIDAYRWILGKVVRHGEGSNILNEFVPSINTYLNQIDNLLTRDVVDDVEIFSKIGFVAFLHDEFIPLMRRQQGLSEDILNRISDLEQKLDTLVPSLSIGDFNYLSPIYDPSNFNMRLLNAVQSQIAVGIEGYTPSKKLTEFLYRLRFATSFDEVFDIDVADFLFEKIRAGEINIDNYLKEGSVDFLTMFRDNLTDFVLDLVKGSEASYRNYAVNSAIVFLRRFEFLKEGNELKRFFKSSGIIDVLLSNSDESRRALYEKLGIRFYNSVDYNFVFTEKGLQEAIVRIIINKITDPNSKLVKQFGEDVANRIADTFKERISDWFGGVLYGTHKVFTTKEGEKGIKTGVSQLLITSEVGEGGVRKLFLSPQTGFNRILHRIEGVVNQYITNLIRSVSDIDDLDTALQDFLSKTDFKKIATSVDVEESSENGVWVLKAVTKEKGKKSVIGSNYVKITPQDIYDVATGEGIEGFFGGDVGKFLPRYRIDRSLSLLTDEELKEVNENIASLTPAQRYIEEQIDLMKTAGADIPEVEEDVVDDAVLWVDSKSSQEIEEEQLQDEFEGVSGEVAVEEIPEEAEAGTVTVTGEAGEETVPEKTEITTEVTPEEGGAKVQEVVKRTEELARIAFERIRTISSNLSDTAISNSVASQMLTSFSADIPKSFEQLYTKLEADGTLETLFDLVLNEFVVRRYISPFVVRMIVDKDGTINRRGFVSLINKMLRVNYELNEDNFIPALKQAFYFLSSTSVARSTTFDFAVDNLGIIRKIEDDTRLKFLSTLYDFHSRLIENVKLLSRREISGVSLSKVRLFDPLFFSSSIEWSKHRTAWNNALSKLIAGKSKSEIQFISSVLNQANFSNFIIKKIQDVPGGTATANAVISKLREFLSSDLTKVFAEYIVSVQPEGVSAGLVAELSRTLSVLVNEYRLEALRVMDTDAKKVADSIGQVLSVVASRQPSPEFVDMVAKVSNWSSEVITNYQVYMSGSSELQSLVQASYKFLYGRDFDVEDVEGIADAVKQVIHEVQLAKDFNDFSYKDTLLQHFNRTNVRIVEADDFATSIRQAVSRLNSGEDLNAVITSLRSKLFMQASATGIGDDVNRMYAKSIDDNLRLISAINQQKEQLITKANLVSNDPEQYSILASSITLLDELVSNYSNHIIYLADSAKSVFPASVLLKNNPDFAYREAIGKILSKLYNKKGGESINRMAWEDYFLRMSALNRKYNERLKLVHDLAESLNVNFGDFSSKQAVLMEKLVRAVDSIDITTRQFFEDFGIEVTTITSRTGTSVRLNQILYRISNPQNPAIKVDVRVVGSSVEMTELHSYFTSQLFGGISDSEVARLLDRPVNEYFKAIRSMPEQIPAPVEEITVAPVKSVSELLSINFKESQFADNATRQTYQDLSFAVKQFINKNTAGDYETLKKNLAVIIESFAKLYKIPTLVGDGITSYNIFVKQLKDALSVLSKGDNNPIYDEVLEILEKSKIRSLNDFITALDPFIARGSTSKRHALISTFINGLNTWFAGTLNLPFSELVSLNGGKEVASVLRNKLKTLFVHSFGMTSRQADEALKFSEVILHRLASLNSSHLESMSMQEVATKMWLTIFNGIYYSNRGSNAMVSLSGLPQRNFLSGDLKFYNQLSTELQELLTKIGIVDEDAVLTKEHVEVLRKILSSIYNTGKVSIKDGNRVREINFITHDFSIERLRQNLNETFGFILRNDTKTVQIANQPVTYSIRVTRGELVSRVNGKLFTINPVIKNNQYFITIAKPLNAQQVAEKLHSFKVDFAGEVVEGSDDLRFIAKVDIADSEIKYEAVRNELERFFASNGFTHIQYKNLPPKALPPEPLSTLYTTAGSIYGKTVFAEEAGGAIKAVLTAFNNANPSTFFHEFYHAIEEFLPVTVRYAINSESFDAIRKMVLEAENLSQAKLAVKDFLKAHSEIKTFDDLMTFVEKNTQQVPEEVATLMSMMKEYSVSAFEGYLLNNLISPTGKGLVTSEFVKQFKDVLLVSYAKYRNKLAKSSGNKQLYKLLDMVLNFDDASKLTWSRVSKYNQVIKKADLNTLEKRMDAFRKAVYVTSNRQVSQALYQRIEPLADSSFKFKAWRLTNPLEFKKANGENFSYLLYSGRLFNSALLDKILPEEVILTSNAFYSLTLDYALSAMPPAFLSMTPSEFRRVYSMMSAENKALADYLLYMFHIPQARFFDLDTLSYKVGAVFQAFDEPEFYAQTFENMKVSVAFTLNNTISYTPERVNELSKIISKFHISIPASFDVERVKGVPAFRKVLSDLKDELNKKFGGNLTQENLFEWVRQLVESEDENVFQKVSDFISGLYNPSRDDLNYHSKMWQVEAYLSHLPDDLRRSVRGGSTIFFVRDDTPVFEIGADGYIRQAGFTNLADAVSNQNVVSKARFSPYLFVGSKQRTLNFTLPNSKLLGKVENINDLVAEFVAYGFNQFEDAMKFKLIDEWLALDIIPENKISFIQQSYAKLMDRLVNEMPARWQDLDEGTKLLHGVLQKIDRNANPDEYARVYKMLRDRLFKELQSTNTTQTRMLEILDLIGTGWWNAVTGAVLDGVTPPESLKILRSAIINEMLGMSGDDAVIYAIRNWNFARLLSKQYDGIFLTFADTGERMLISFNPKNLVSLNEIFSENVSDELADYIANVDTLAELLSSDTDIYLPFEGYAERLVLKRGVLPVLARDDTYDATYLIHLGALNVKEPSVVHEIEWSLRPFFRRFVGMDAHIVKYSDTSYVIFGKHSKELDDLIIELEDYYQKRVFVNYERTQRYASGIQVRRINRKEIIQKAEIRDAVNYTLPFVGTAKSLVQYPENGIIKVGGVEYIPISRIAEPTSFKVRKLTVNDNFNHPTWMMPVKPQGREVLVVSDDSQALLNALGISEYDSLTADTRKAILRSLANENPVTAISNAVFTIQYNFDPKMVKNPVSSEEIARLISMWTNLRSSTSAERKAFVDYLLTSCLAEMEGVSRIRLANSNSYYYISVKELYELPPSISTEYKATVDKVGEYTRILDYYDGVLNGASELDNLMRSKVIADTASQINGTSQTYNRKWFELYQTVDAEPAGNVQAFSAFVKAKILPVSIDGTTKLVSIEDMLTFALPNQTLYTSPTLFSRAMSILIDKLAQDTSTDNSNYIRMFEWLRGIVDSFVAGENMESIGTFEFTPSPAFNLVFDYNVMRYVADNLYSLTSYLNTLNGLKVFEGEISKALLNESPMLDFESYLANPFYQPIAQSFLREANEKLASALHEIWDLVNRGGTTMIKNQPFSIERGAVNEMNRIMIDYFSTTRADEWMKMILPFWMYPSRSLPYWMDLISRHPEILAFYGKYREWSDNINWQDGAITTSGDILPSLKGYLPLGVGLYFNPLAPFLFRFVVPNIQDLPETRPESEMGVFQKVARFFLDTIPQYGFSINPILQSLLTVFYEPYYPKSGLMYELVRSLLPLEWIPPVLERAIISKLRQVTHVDMPEVWKPEVSWFDYLVEQEILATTLTRINQATTQEEKQRLAKWAYDLITDPNRQTNPDWRDFENGVRMSDYFRHMAGNFTGIYAKTLSPARADLLKLRNDINGLKKSINDIVQANIFDLYGTPTELYNLYNKTRFETPEGQIYQLYQMTRYIIDPTTGQFARGAERERLLIENAKVENATQMYYKAIEEENQRYMKELALIPIGNTEARRKLREEHYDNLLKIRTDPMYEKARRTRYFGVKPEAVLYDDLYQDWWFALTATEPKYADYNSYEDYVEAREEWLKNIKEDAEILLPIFTANMLVKARNEEMPPDRIEVIKKLINRIASSTNAEEYEKFKDSGKTIYDAIWDAYQATYVDKFYDAVKDKTGFERELAEKEFLMRNPVPDQSAIVKWIKGRFGNKFSEKEILSILSTNKPLTIPQREDLSMSQIEKDGQALLKRLYNAGNRSSEMFKKFVRSYVLLGGYESDIDLMYAIGSDPTKFGDPQKFYDIYDRMMRAFEMAGVPEELTIPELKERIDVERMNDAFKEAVVRELGDDYYNLMSFYYMLSEKEQKQFRQQNPELYAKIRKYYQMRDEFSQLYPLWAKYYNPDFDPQKKPSAGFVSGGDGYYRSTSSRSALRAVRDVTSFLHMGKRSTMDAMRLFLDNVLGKGGAEKRPVLTKELRELIGEYASEEIESGRADEETIRYLNKLARTNPSQADKLKKLAQQIRRGGDLTMKRQVEDFQ